MPNPSFVMCPPEYYQNVYEMNPWKSVRRHIDLERAKEQWQEFYELLTKELGISVELVTPAKDCPNLVFCGSAGLVHKRWFLRSNLRNPARQGEEQFWEKWFKKRGAIVKTIPDPLYLEGAADALWAGENLYCGCHARADLAVHDYLADEFNFSLFGLPITDNRFGHLEMCFAPFRESSALVYFDALEPYAREILRENFEDAVAVPEDEALKHVCQAVISDRHAILPKHCPQTTKVLEKRGFHVYDLDFSEFQKALGGPSSLVLKV